MKIALILAAPPGYSETFFTNKIRVLEAAGHSVRIYCNEDGSGAAFPYRKGLSTTGHIFKPKNFYSVLVALCRVVWHPLKALRLFILNRNDHYSTRDNIRSLLVNAHILHSRAHWVYFGFATIALGRENLALCLKSKLAVSIRGYDMAIYPLKHPGCYDLLWEKTDKLHYISDHLLRLAQQNGLPDRVNRQKITPAVDTRLFQITGNRHFFSSGEVQLLTVSRLSWKKGLIYTLQALADLKKSGTRFSYTIIGEGDEKERIRYALHELDLSDRVTLIGTAKPEMVADHLSRTDIYIQYSVQEGFSNAVLEAQGCGCLCIVSDAGGLTENVIDGETGWVVPGRAPNLLTETIRQILEVDASVLQQVSQRAAQRVQQEFNLENQQQQFLSFYSE